MTNIALIFIALSVLIFIFIKSMRVVSVVAIITLVILIVVDKKELNHLKAEFNNNTKMRCINKFGDVHKVSKQTGWFIVDDMVSNDEIQIELYKCKVK